MKNTTENRAGVLKKLRVCDLRYSVARYTKLESRVYLSNPFPVSQQKVS